MVSLRSVSDALFGKQSLQLIEIADSGTILEADAVITESYSKSANVTSYPVENGNDIAEHAMVNSFSISIEGISSDASMSYFDTITQIGGSPLGKLFGGSTKSQGVWTQLNDWVDSGAALQVKCIYAKKGFVDKNDATIPFVIENLSVARNKDIGQAIRYNLTLKQIALVQIGKGSLVDEKLAIFDTGVKQLEAGGGADAVAKQPTATKTPVKLRDGKYKNNIPGLFTGTIEYVGG